MAGVGALGGALVQDLAKKGRWIHLYDTSPNYERPKTSTQFTKLALFLNNCDLVFGCTGRNFIRIELLRKIKPDHSLHFVSCSSRDTEFLDLLRFGKIRQETVRDGYGRLEIGFEEKQSHFLENGGFPINFDRVSEQENAEEIVLTRALVLAGIFQALCVRMRDKRDDVLMLSPSLQQSLVAQWLGLTSQDRGRFEIGGDIGALEWWRSRSSGIAPQQTLNVFLPPQIPPALLPARDVPAPQLPMFAPRVTAKLTRRGS